MSKFETGNVVKLSNGSIVIVVDKITNTKGKLCISWISFDAEKCSGITNIEPYTTINTCFCHEHNEGEYDKDCLDCKGFGSYSKLNNGMVGSVILGSSVKEYIIKSLTKNFNF